MDWQHIYPLDEQDQHELKSHDDWNLCECHPRLEDGLVIHNSFNKREIGEFKDRYPKVNLSNYLGSNGEEV